ncbi:MAG: phosphatase PAP2 family protein [Candidatus Aminicenantes bacterium]|nr:phosphatase PAP2 family protein [Candidatus Aminicenantes bacterium]
MSNGRRPIAAIFLIFVLASGATFAPAANNPSTTNPDWRLNGDYLRKIPSDLVTAWTAPVRWDGNDFLKLAAFAGATGLLFVFDREIYDWIQGHKTTASIDASRVISKFGNGGYLAGFLAVLYGGGEIFDSRPLRKTALLGLESFVAASAVIFVFKIVAGRARPYAGEGPDSFHPFSFKGRYISFASGDAAGAFAIATTIAERSDSFWVDALAYTAAGLAAFYRVHDRKHWPSDVFAGSAIGYFTARAINALNKDGDGVQVSFQAGPDSRSVTLSFAF